MITPLVSVVIPCYNRSLVIDRTLQSVFLQTEQNFEIIIVDDCSDDIEQLRALIESYHDDRIQLIEHSENKHGGAARNTGILASKGTYIALLDSDDIWRKNKLELCVAICVGRKDVVHSKVEGFNYTFPSRGKVINEPVSEYLLCNGGGMQSSTLVLHTSFAKRVLFNPDLPRFQDYDFALRLENEGANFIFIDKVLVRMFDDGGSRITSHIDYEPALYWLKNCSFLTVNARYQFYIGEVVRLLVESGNKHKIYSLMPGDIEERLTTFHEVKLMLLKLSPAFLIALLLRLRAIGKRIIPSRIKKIMKKYFRYLRYSRP